MAYIKFTKGAETFTFSKGREYPLNDPVRVNVVLDYSEGGKPYAYDKGIQQQFFNLRFNNLPKTDHDNVENWLINVAVGPKNTFTYTDEDETDHTVRMLDTENPLQQDSHEQYSGTIHLLEEL